MIVIVKLTTGQEIIGEIDDEALTLDDLYYNIENPMTFVGIEDTGVSSLRLRDVMLLSDESMITIPTKHIITHYAPSKVLSEYYLKASSYAASHTRPADNNLIEAATQDIDSIIKEEHDSARAFTDMLVRASGTRIH